MKYSPLFCLLLLSICMQAQSGKDESKAVQVLQKTLTKLNSMQSVSYHYTREMRYYEDNYYNMDSAAVHILYEPRNIGGLRFQATHSSGRFIYDGVRTLRLNDKNMTIDTATVKTTAALEGNSFLYHSLATLRNILPLIIQSDNIQKSVTDTMLHERRFLCVRMEAPGRYFGGFNGIQQLPADANLKRPYYLLIDPQTGLPYQYIAKLVRGTDDRDFITVTYKSIDANPAALKNDSWLYATYATRYSPFKAKERKPVIKPGALVHDFTLPHYTAEAIDSISLQQFAGKVVLLDFWFKSCGPCMQAMPHYNTLQQKFGKDGFQLITINIEDGVDDMKFFYNKYQPNYYMLFKGQTLFDQLGLSGCPSSILLDKNSKVTHVFHGFNQSLIEGKIAEVMIQ
jgi:thiol-disulfide isomerase/thioredoxin